MILILIVLLCGMRDVCAMDSNPDNALMAAICAKNDQGVSDALLQEVQINLRNKNYSLHTPLSEAVAGGNEAIVGLLLEYPEIEIDTTLENDWTALHIASHHKHSKIVRMLLKRGAKLFVVNNESRTPLHEAVYAGDKDSVCALVTQIPQKRLWAHVRTISFPLLCCFKRFAVNDGISVSIPKDIQLLLCRYVLKANIPEIVQEQLKCLQPILSHQDNAKKEPCQAGFADQDLPPKKDAKWFCIHLISGQDQYRRTMITNYLSDEIDQLNLTSKPHNLGKLQIPPMQNME